MCDICFDAVSFPILSIVRVFVVVVIHATRKSSAYTKYLKQFVLLLVFTCATSVNL